MSCVAIQSRKIKNFDQLAVSKEREIALNLIEEALRAIDTKSAVLCTIRLEDNRFFVGDKSFDLKSSASVHIVSIGKCALEAAQAIEEIFGDRIAKGVVLDVREGELKNKNIKSFAGSHPFPEERNILATNSVINALSGLKEEDLVLVVVSGGGSSLLCQNEKLTCDEEKSVVSALFRAGAPIRDVNTVRKHLSLARGGYLAKYAYPARVVSLIFSDVPGNDVSFVSSGPTVLDETTIDDAKKILEKYNIPLWRSFAEAGLIETPKDGKYFDKVFNLVVVSNEIALRQMTKVAEDLGFNARIQTTHFSGYALDLGEGIVHKIHTSGRNTFFLYGGESTVILKGGGKGGRNLELALSALRFIDEKDLVISFASDGKDNTEFAGGICDIITKKKAEKLQLDIDKYLEGNDSFHFFEKTGDFIETGETGSNVSDLIIAVHFSD